MKYQTKLGIMLGYFALAIILSTGTALACSTFKLQKGDGLIYGHNLNQGDMDVPGLLMINQRGIFKTGRTWSELTTKDELNPSKHTWISWYGSLTFNCFGKDLPDGGMNEAGLVIWEMSDDIVYPQNDSLPKLSQMNWMQYILDNYSTVDEAIQCAHDFQIDGWGWHYFIGDAAGNTAAISFKDGKVVVNHDENMPIPALFNTPYNRELELLNYYQDFGGSYPINIHDPKIPRFVRAVKMIEQYKPSRNIVKYGFKMLKNLRVNDDPEWSVIFDIRKREVHFKTRMQPAIKSLSMSKIDFSNEQPLRFVNINKVKAGRIQGEFEEYSNAKMSNFTSSFVMPLLPEQFFTSGGISTEEYLRRTSTHTDAATLEENQYFKGNWEYQKDNGEIVTYELKTHGAAVTGRVVMAGGTETFNADHLQLIGNQLSFTYRKTSGMFVEMEARIEGDSLAVALNGIEDSYGNYVFTRKHK